MSWGRASWFFTSTDTLLLLEESVLAGYSKVNGSRQHVSIPYHSRSRGLA